MFSIDEFVSQCRGALNESDARGAVKDIVERVVSQPGAILDALGEPHRAEAQNLYQADDLTVLNLVWGPGMTLYPHDHRMWAVIGIYGGREDNTFYRRSEDGLVMHGTRVLDAGDVASLGENAIHSVHNPLTRLTAALHVYGGDFFETPRSEWDPDTLVEEPYSVERVMRLFEESNANLEATMRDRNPD